MIQGVCMNSYPSIVCMNEGRNDMIIQTLESFPLFHLYFKQYGVDHIIVCPSTDEI